MTADKAAYEPRQVSDQEPATLTLPKGLVSTPDTLGGAVRIGGHRITTQFIKELHASGESEEDIAEDYELTASQVRLALRYEADLWAWINGQHEDGGV